MKVQAWRSAALIAAIAVVFGIVMAGMMEAQTVKIDKNNRTIAVTASEKATTDADLAVVHVGFQVFGPDEPTTYA
ncbi:MAG TPA: hypothetical protein VE178_18440, partial [Silvibacterium sp.]|nr:hypothetical protein [Silvibacterium sp.]